MHPMNREKRFRSRTQEQVYRQVREYLNDLVEEHFDDAEHCDFYMKFGSTIVEIAVEPYEQDDAVVDIVAYCVQGVDPTPELMRELLRINAEVRMGAFSLVENDVFFSHAFLGRRLDPGQLLASLSHVATVADEYDDVIVSRFGGETAIDRLRHVSPRTVAAPAN